MTEEQMECSFYEGEAGSRYFAARQSEELHIGHKMHAEFFLTHLSEAHSCLDFGCGNGWLLRSLQDQIAVVEGVEVNPLARAYAEQHGAKVFSSLEEIPRDRMYDAIVSNHVFEHIADVPAVIRSLREHLSVGGCFIIMLPIDDFRAKYQRGWDMNDVDRHLHTWTPRLIANNLFMCGLRVESIKIVTSAWHPRLLWLGRFGLHRIGFWLFATIKRRRQLLVVALR
jgi:2-polyprenyl-3-methyl-5-hydroxy-6-metoxy-1,4-benzoquinol methylase